MPQATGPLIDARVNDVIARLQAERNFPSDGGPRRNIGRRDPHLYAEYGFSIFPEQGDLIYLLCRALRQGDARQTLRELGGAVDFVLIDNAEPDYLDYVRDPANGFRSLTLPLKGGTELSVKVG